ncbi:MAG TPA: sporulation protein YjcZ [Candidatus Faecisoma merdavium]|nr:sporulation protein YjcZ [Candidatus Faecisoma merdavium]
MYYYGGYSGYGYNQPYGYGTGYGAAIVLVLFILLVIIIGARAFENNCGCHNQTPCQGR